MRASDVAYPANGTVTDRSGNPRPAALTADVYPLWAICQRCDSRITAQDGTADWTHLSGQVLCGPADGPPPFLDPEGEAAAFDSWAESTAAPGTENAPC